MVVAVPKNVGRAAAAGPTTPAAACERTPLVAGTAGTAGPSTLGRGADGPFADSGRIVRDAACTFGASCALGASSAWALTHVLQTQTPLVVGLPLTAVTALGLTSWRMTRAGDTQDLESGLVQGASPAPPRPALEPLYSATAPFGLPGVWVPTPAGLLLVGGAYPQAPSAAVASTRPKRTPIRRARQAPYARAKRHAGAIAEQQRRRREGVARAPGDKSRAADAGRAIDVAHKASHSSSCATSLAASDRTLVCQGFLQAAPRASRPQCPSVSQSMPAVPTLSATWPHAGQSRLVQSDALAVGPRAHVPGADTIKQRGDAQMLAQVHTLAERLQGLAHADATCDLGAVDTESLIMPALDVGGVATGGQRSSERSSLSELFLDSASPSSVRTPSPETPTGD